MAVVPDQSDPGTVRGLKIVPLRLAALFLALLIGACAGAPSVTIEGELAYRERMALPDGAYARVALLETGADGDDLVSEQELRHVGQVPIPFSLTVPGEILDRSREYGLRAAILMPDGRPGWATPETVPVDPFAPPEKLPLRLRRASGGK